MKSTSFQFSSSPPPQPGMPGWGGEDEENWKLVLFIRHLPELAEKELELMKDINDLETDGEHGETHGGH